MIGTGIGEDATMPTHTARVLVVEDDHALREAVSSSLTTQGYEVCELSDGRRLEDTVAVFRPDVAVVDVGLPAGPDGFSVGAQLCAASVPVVFVTAADALEDRLRGFAVGADDYLVKPFALAELLVRLGVVLRRAGWVDEASWTVGDLVVDGTRRVVTRSGCHVELTRTEFDLLAVLTRSTGVTFSKMRLLSLVWGFDGFAENLVEVHISALRRKLEAHGARLIHTERGEGYVVRP
jgi:two-component system, OmpR family, response regulator